MQESKPVPSSPLRPLGYVERQLIRARAINASALTAPGVVLGNRAFLRVCAARRARQTSQDRPQ